MTLNKDAKAFVTGSHAYGLPGPDSDMDLVVYVTQKDLDRLKRLADEAACNQLARDYIAAGGTPLRFGRLNLICCTNEKYFEVWREGTRRLRKQAPVTRHFACCFLAKLRREAGFNVPIPIREKKHREKDVPF